MQVNQHAYSKNHFMVAFVLLLLGCSSPIKMSMPLQDVQQFAPNEGIVTGSVLIKGGKAIMGLKTWTLLAKDTNGKSKDYSVQAKRGGDEIIFVTKMPVGNYHFYELYNKGFFGSKSWIKINIHFEVQPEKTVYIGRLVIEFSGLIMLGSRPSLKVENSKEAAIALTENKYKNLIREASTDLMVIEPIR